MRTDNEHGGSIAYMHICYHVELRCQMYVGICVF